MGINVMTVVDSIRDVAVGISLQLCIIVWGAILRLMLRIAHGHIGMQLLVVLGKEALRFILGLSIVSSILVTVRMATLGYTRPSLNDGVISMCLYMLLKVLRPLEGLPTELASMRLQRHVNTDVRGDVIALYNSNSTVTPSACQIEVIGTLTANMAFADMVVELLSVGGTLATSNPLALELAVRATLEG